MLGGTSDTEETFTEPTGVLVDKFSSPCSPLISSLDGAGVLMSLVVVLVVGLVGAGVLAEGAVDLGGTEVLVEVCGAAEAGATGGDGLGGEETAVGGLVFSGVGGFGMKRWGATGSPGLETTFVVVGGFNKVPGLTGAGRGGAVAPRGGGGTTFGGASRGGGGPFGSGGRAGGADLARLAAAAAAAAASAFPFVFFPP